MIKDSHTLTYSDNGKVSLINTYNSLESAEKAFNRFLLRLAQRHEKLSEDGWEILPNRDALIAKQKGFSVMLAKTYVANLE